MPRKYCTKVGIASPGQCFSETGGVIGRDLILSNSSYITSRKDKQGNWAPYIQVILKLNNFLHAKNYRCKT